MAIALKDAIASAERLAIAESILAQDVAAAMHLLHSAADEGLQLGELLDQLVEHWRWLMLLNSAGGDPGAVGMSGSNREELKRQAAKVSLDAVLAGLDVLTTTKSRLRGSSYALVLLEMAVVVTYQNEVGMPPTMGTFEVQVDGTTVGAFAPNAAAAGLYDATYRVPAAITATKRSVTVRFQSGGTGRIATVFGVRTVRARDL